MTRQQERRYQELQEAFARLKPRFEELWDGICEVEVEVEQFRIDAVHDGINKCYQHLAEAYWTIWTEVDRHHPALNPHSVRWLLNDSALVTLTVEDGWSFCRVKMMADVSWTRVFQRYCEENGITQESDVVGYIRPCQD